MVSTVAKKLGSFRAAIDEALNELDGIRDQIRAKQNERGLLEFHHLDKDTATARIDRSIAASRAKGLGSGWQDPGPATQGHQLFNDVFSGDVFGAFAVIAPDLLRAGLVATLDESGMSPGDKVKALKRLDAEIFALGKSEELQVRDLEAAGQSPQRRGDADPVILLMPTEEL